jgi:4-hydroxybenzoate polyprenyltransferase
MTQSSEVPSDQRPSVSPVRRSHIVLLLEMIRFSHTVFALPFALLATLLAIRVPLPHGAFVSIRPQDLLGILLCMVFARSAAMTFNRIVDRDLDRANPRTMDRHLPAKTLSLKSAWLFFFGCAMSFVGSTSLFLPNWIPLAVSAPILAWLCGYSFAKRFTAAAHLWLGIALAASPLCAWIALRGIDAIVIADLLPPLVLSAAVACWVAGFDIIYACQDEAHDRAVGLHSLPARRGVASALRMSAWLHVAMIGFLCWFPFTGERLGLGWLYGIALLVIAGLLVYQHLLVRPNDLQRVGLAFFNLNAAISVVLMTCAGIDTWLG